MANATDVLMMWCIYEHPRDYPDKWIARAWAVGASFARVSSQPILGDSLADVRRQLPAGLFRIERDPFDDPAIREVWL